MSATILPSPARARPRGRVAAFVAAGLLGLASLAAFAVGGGALYGNHQKDDAGYLATHFHRFTSDRSAIATDDLDIDSQGSGWLLDTDSYGKVRIRVRSHAAKPVFVGIARSRDVRAYLAASDHTRLTDVDFDPFSADYRDRPAAHRPAAPASQSIWAASSQGVGRRTVTWDVKHGAWSVVLMNADGSPRVDADVSAGADLPVLDEIAWTGLGLGLVLAIAAAGTALLASRRS